MRALRAVDGKGKGVVVLEEIELVVDMWKLVGSHLRGHEVGEDLLCPHIVKPAHRHQIAKPHVGRLVRDELEATQLVVLGRLGTQEDGTGVELYRPRMLHATKLIARENDKVVFGEGIGNAGIVLQPADRPCGLSKALVELLHLLGIGLSIECVHCPAVDGGRFALKLTRGKGEKVGGDRMLGIGTRDIVPPLGEGELEREKSLEVGLVETGEDATRIGWDKERIEIVVMAVEGGVATRKLQFNTVGTLAKQTFRDDNMLLLHPRLREAKPIDGRLPRERSCEVEDEVALAGPMEKDRSLAGHPLCSLGRDVEAKQITDIRDFATALLGKRMGDAVVDGPRSQGREQQGEKGYDFFHATNLRKIPC